MPSIYAIGETVYDIIFRHGQPVAAKPGGSKLNSAVSLGRCGLNVEMITEIGDDAVGKLIMDFLAENGVSTSFLHPVKGFKTPVSLAFLDDHGNAAYSFYKNYPAERLAFHWPKAVKGDVVLFGSFYSLEPAVFKKLLSYLQQARSTGALLIYDPNIRKNHLEVVRQRLNHVEQFISLSHIVRGSDEDFDNLFGTVAGEKIFEKTKSLGCQNVIITRGQGGCEFFSESHRIHLPAKEISVVSTIGAGDAFNAGLIYGIIKKGVFVDQLVNITTEDWTGILVYGTNFAADVCSGYDNYISKGFME